MKFGLTPARVDALLLLVFFGLKCWINDQRVDWWYDGNYYADIARHLAKGEGFTSSISMFHAGLPSFPFPSPVYPLWPLLLGAVATVVPLETAAVWMPTALYMGTLFLAARLGRRLLPTQPFAALPLDGGHLTLLVWALANRFVEVTSLPYTEGLAMFLLAAALLRVGSSAPTLLAGVEAGLWCAAMLAARGPFVVPVVAILGVLWLAEGRFRRAMAATLTLSVCAVLADRLWFRTIPGASIVTLLRFDHWVVTPGLSGVDLFVEPATFGATVLDRIRGVSAAYSPAGSFRIMKNFGFLAYLPFLVLVPALAREVWRTLQESLLLRLAFAVGLAQLALLHLLHKQAFAEWNFPIRHALPVLWLYVALFPAVFGARLLQAPAGPLLRTLATALLCGGLAFGVEWSMGRRNAIHYSPSSYKYRKAVAAWMMARRKEDADLRIANPTPQLYARHTRGVGLIATHPFTTLDDLQGMVREGGMDYLVMTSSAHKAARYPFQQDAAAFAAVFERLPEAPGGAVIFRPRKESP